MSIQTEEITFPAVSGRLAGYLASPDGAGPWPGLIVIHEAFGLNDNMRAIARRLAG